ncbi:hypothetical protein vBCbaSRXM_84 [Citromicrobium phage vB_CbaS-RXM]|nr:hypothetical protein vBCbaSRXM_84 [Citromicrobium phage vB_CbaS-RXM]
MSVYDPPIFGSIITAARTVAILLAVFCVAEVFLARLGLYRLRRSDPELETLAWLAFAAGVIFSGSSFIVHDLLAIQPKDTFLGQCTTSFIWSMFGLGFVLRAASRAARPFEIFMTGSAIFFVAILISVLTGEP